ncbi:unnamed protein product, partial [Choristocarpus tenellus]
TSTTNGNITSSANTTGAIGWATYAVANYTSGNGTKELTFVYTVDQGDSTKRLDYVSPATSALSAPFGSILAVGSLQPVYSTSYVNATLSTPGEPGSLSYSSNISVDTTPPSVTSISTTRANGTYTVGAEIDVVVAFSAPVVLYRGNDTNLTPVMATVDLDISGMNGDRNATYARGNQTSELVFSYKVQ